MTKAISAIIATIMLLMITVSLVGVFYVFSSTLATQSTSSSSEQASQLTAQLSMCMQVDNIIGNQVTLRNCGKGVIENKSLVVMMDDVALGANTNTIMEGNSSIVNVSGLWQVPFGKHSLKITNGAAVALALVDVQPNKDGLVGSWDFSEGTGNVTYDDSGNGNVGTLNNMNTTGNSTSGWAAGKFGFGLLFDGTDDYVNAGNGASLNFGTGSFTISTWVKGNSFSGAPILGKGNIAIANAKYGIRFTASNRICIDLADGINGGQCVLSAIGNFNVNDNNWHFISGIINRDTQNVLGYVDGVFISFASISSIGSINSGTSLQIGEYGSSGFFNGIVDEVRIWNRTLAPDEIVVMKQII